MSLLIPLIIKAVTVAAAATSVSAQHASFVLLGGSNPTAFKVSETRQSVAPISSLYLRDDAFVTSDVRAIFMH